MTVKTNKSSRKTKYRDPLEEKFQKTTLFFTYKKHRQSRM